MRIRFFILLFFCSSPLRAAVNGTGTQAIDLDTNTSLIKTTTFTFTTWVRLNANQTVREFITCAGAGTVTGYGMGVDDTTNNKLKFYTANNSGTSQNLVSNAAIPINTDVHVAFVYQTQPSGTNKWIYINGVLDNSVATSIAIGYNGATCGLMKYDAAGTQFLNGSLDDSHFYPRALSLNEIKDQANRRVRLPCAKDDCAAYWRLDEGLPGVVATGSLSIRDFSGNGVHGTPTSVIYRGSTLSYP